MTAAASGSDGPVPAFMLSSLKPTAGKFVLGPPVDTTPPVVVFTGPPDHPDPVQSESHASRKKRAHKHSKPKGKSAKQ